MITLITVKENKYPERSGEIRFPLEAEYTAEKKKRKRKECFLFISNC